MLEIKSYEWEILAGIISNEDPIAIKYIFDYLVEQTKKFEEIGGSYPRIEYAISVALDKWSEEKKNKIEEIKKTIIPIIPITPKKEELSPKCRREIVRNAWSKKFPSPPKASEEISLEGGIPPLLTGGKIIRGRKFRKVQQ